MQVKEIEVGKFYEVLYGRMYRNVLVLEKNSNHILCYDFTRRGYRTFFTDSIQHSFEIISPLQIDVLKLTRDIKNANRR